jgi:hypothetical protein
MYPNWNWKELTDLLDRAAKLSPGEQLHIIERLASNIRNEQFTDHAALDRAMEEMAADPGIQRALRNEDLVAS